MRAGASGFLLKDSPENQLVATIRVAANGGAMFSPSITRRLIEEFTRRAAGLSNQKIAARLVVGEHTAKTHVAHILQKLDLRDRVKAVVLAYESGLVQPGAAFSES